MISSSVLLKEGEFWFVVNRLCVAMKEYLRLYGSCGSMAQEKTMSQVEYVTQILEDQLYPGRHRVVLFLGQERVI